MDDFGLDGKVALIAGGGSRDEGIGNGRGAAVLLARVPARKSRSWIENWRPPSAPSP